MRANTSLRNIFEENPVLFASLADSRVFKNQETASLGDLEDENLETGLVVNFYGYVPYYESIINNNNVDSSSVFPNLEVKSERLWSSSEIVSINTIEQVEEELLLGLLNMDFDIRMPPKQEFDMVVKVVHMERAVPKIVSENE